jgi:hypothetical protein
MEQRIRSEIAKRQAELETLDARAAVVRIELGVLQGLLGNSPRQSPPPERRPPSLDASDAGHDRGRGVISGRRLREKWAIVLAEAVRRYPAGVMTDEVESIQRRNGIEPASRTNIRSHFWTCTKAGLYEHIGHATYQATQKAADAVGVPLGESAKKDDEPSPDRANGSVAGEDDDASPSSPSLWSNP